MKTWFVFSSVAMLMVGLISCNNTSVDPSTVGSARTSSVSSTTATGPANLTAVDVASLPAAITTYITSNYSGAAIKDARKDAQGDYIVAITANNGLKLLLFKADGTFVKEAELKFGHAPGDSAHHHMPGDSAHRPHTPGDSLHHPKPVAGDTTHRPHPGGGPELTNVAVASLPAAITSYVTTNYAGATIEEAAQEKKTSDYIVAIKTTDKKQVVLLFSADGTFKKALIHK